MEKGGGKEDGGRGSSLLGEECCGFPVRGDPEEQSGCLLFHTPPGFPSQLLEKYPNVTSHRSLQVVCFLVVCGGDRTHTHSSVRQTSRRGPVLWQGRWGGGSVFYLPVENGGVFYDPCSLSSCKNHTSSFPGLQHHRPRRQWKQQSVWRRNKANPGEREKKTSSWTEIPAAGLEMYTSSEGEPPGSSWRYTAFQGQSQLAISQSAPEALRLQQEVLLGQAQQSCSNAWTHRMWVGNRAQICFMFLKCRSFFSSSNNKNEWYEETDGAKGPKCLTIECLDGETLVHVARSHHLSPPPLISSLFLPLCEDDEEEVPVQ